MVLHAADGGAADGGVAWCCMMVMVPLHGAAWFCCMVLLMAVLHGAAW